MSAKKPLEGVKVIEMSTFIAVPACARYFAEFGADVIKIEPKTGDAVRFNGESEGRLGDPYENTTFDLENAHKRSLVVNLKDPEGREILYKLLADTDIFLTNWRPQALEKLGLDYASLKEKFPKLVYASLTGFGETGPDRELPGYDFTAFWGRGGLLGTLYQKDSEPINLIPGMGDHITGMCMAAGIMTSLYNAEKTGIGDYVTVNLLHTAIWVQGIAIQAAQYTGLGQVYPISRKTAENPFNNTYMSKDGRHIQISMPPFDLFYPRFMPLIGRADLVGNDNYKINNITRNKLHGEFIQILSDAFATKTAEEWSKILTEGDIPFSICHVWEEVLEDKQAWATGVFREVDYPSAKRAVVNPPVRIEGADFLPFERAPMLAEDSEQILKELGYSDEQLKDMHARGVYNSWDDVKDYIMSKA